MRKNNIFLLASVFKNFSDEFKDIHKLDPAHFYT